LDSALRLRPGRTLGVLPTGTFRGIDRTDRGFDRTLGRVPRRAFGVLPSGTDGRLVGRTFRIKGRALGIDRTFGREHRTDGLMVEGTIRDMSSADSLLDRAVGRVAGWALGSRPSGAERRILPALGLGADRAFGENRTLGQPERTDRILAEGTLRGCDDEALGHMSGGTFRQGQRTDRGIHRALRRVVWERTFRERGTGRALGEERRALGGFHRAFRGIPGRTFRV